ncbi:MAG: FAD-dependent oxidoreductase [Rhodospirillaceae bacterium]|nr:FAD-dependent oxidoreductase [Rhodospirillaceae bacterium]MBT6510388.1 FAD-dependent oxidoreductase [Rhodospirillaceae bacterium]
MMAAFDALFAPLTIKRMVIPNRFASTSHAPGYASGGRVTERYVRYEAEKARGGVGLVQFGGATTVSIENTYYYGQLNGTGDAIIADLARIARAIHEHGSVCTVQLSHGGRRERHDMAHWIPAFAPSVRRELKHRAFPAEIEHHDIDRVARDYATAACRIRDSGVDGVEISCIPPGLIGQFWSPLTNQRTDDYGGSLHNRLRFGFEVLEQTRNLVGEDYVVGMRLSADEFTDGGLDNQALVEIAGRYAECGLVDYVSVVGGHSSDHRTNHDMYPSMHKPRAPYLSMAAAIKEKVDLPVLHATRIADAATAAHAVEQGYIDLVGMTRAFIADPHHVRKLREGRETDIRPCVGATYCNDRVNVGLEALCLHNVATGREEHLDHDVAASTGPVQRVVVVGGGPAGLEAARVAASRGHAVVLLEAGDRLGGQLNLATRCAWRKDLGSIVDWLVEQVEKLGVDVRLNRLAEAADVLALNPEVVVIATGGMPVVGHFRGADLAVTTWDILAGQVEPGDDILIFDEAGSNAGLTTAEVMAKRGSDVELVSPDTAHGAEVGNGHRTPHMTELYRAGVKLTVDSRLVEVRRSGNKFVAVLTNTYLDQTEERIVDQVVGDYGTLPNDDLFEVLKTDSKNRGELDLEELAAFRAQTRVRNPEGSYVLYKAGDVWAGRNVHAAMFDAARICQRI